MNEVERECLRRIIPVLIHNLDLDESEVVESLQRDDVISISDAENYVYSQGSRESQVLSLVHLLMHRSPNCLDSGEDTDGPLPHTTLEALRRAFSTMPQTRFLTNHLDRIIAETSQQQPGCPTSKHNSTCIHCTILNILYDVREITDSIYQGGYLTDDTYMYFKNTSERKDRTGSIKKLLNALAKDGPRPHAPKDRSPVKCLSDALSEKYPELSGRLGRHDVVTSDLVVCKCKDIKRPISKPVWDKSSSKSRRKQLVHGYKKQALKTKAQKGKHIDRVSLLRELLSWSPDTVPYSPPRVEGGPDKQQMENVKLCIKLDQVINHGSLEHYETFTQKMLDGNPGNIDVEITVYLHDIFAHTSIDYDTIAARERFDKLRELIPLSTCSSYFEVDFLGMQARVFKKERLDGKLQECLTSAVQKAELLIPERLTSFVFTRYAEFLIHMYKNKLFDDNCPQRIVNEIEAYMVGGLRRCQASVEQQLASSEMSGESIADSYSSGGRTFVKLVFVYLRSCLQGHMLQQVFVPSDALRSASQCLDRLDAIYNQLPPKMQFHVLMAHTDYLIRSGEQSAHPIGRHQMLQEALKFALDGKMFATKKKYKSLFVAADRRIEYIQKKIELSPIVAMDMDISSQSDSVGGTSSDVSA